MIITKRTVAAGSQWFRLGICCERSPIRLFLSYRFGRHPAPHHTNELYDLLSPMYLPLSRELTTSTKHVLPNSIAQMRD